MELDRSEVVWFGAPGRTHLEYDGAGHGFFYYHRPMYRVEQALDGWEKIFAFFGKHLSA